MEEKREEGLSGIFHLKKFILFAITAIITLIIWNLPSDSFGIEGLTVVQQRVIAIFVMAVLLWLTEAIPAWATSVVIIFVLLFCVSNSSFKFFQGNEGEYGQLIGMEDSSRGILLQWMQFLISVITSRLLLLTGWGIPRRISKNRLLIPCLLPC